MMTSTTPLSETGALLRAHARPLVRITLLFYVPFFLAYKGVVASGALPDEAADRLFGVLGGFLAPVSNGAMVYLLHHAQAGILFGTFDGIRAGWRVFGRLLTSYIIISVIFLFWAVLPAIPALAYLGFAKARPETIMLLAPLALPAVYVVSRYAFIDATTVLEDLQAPAARFRSIDLARPRRLRLAIWALLMMALPTLVDFGADPLAGLAQKELGIPVFPVAVALNVLASLLYVLPLVYFYAEYRERVRLLAAAPRANAGVPPLTVPDPAKVLAFKKPESGGPRP